LGFPGALLVSEDQIAAAASENAGLTKYVKIVNASGTDLPPLLEEKHSEEERPELRRCSRSVSISAASDRIVSARNKGGE
jgi:hypothetical protein